MSNSKSTATCATDYRTGRPIAGTPVPRPCPFCDGSEVGVVHRPAAEDGDMDNFNVGCQNCAYDGPTADTALEAVALWNARGMARIGPH